jgi:hypothetical protein
MVRGASKLPNQMKQQSAELLWLGITEAGSNPEPKGPGSSCLIYSSGWPALYSQPYNANNLN